MGDSSAASSWKEVKWKKSKGTLAEVKKGEGEETQQFWRVLPEGCPLQLPAT